MDHCLADPLEANPFRWLPRIRGFPRLYFQLKIQPGLYLNSLLLGSYKVELLSSYLSSQNKLLPLPLICPRTFLLSHLLFYKNSSAPACCFVAVSSQSHRVHVTVLIQHSTYFFSNLLTSWEVTMETCVVIGQRSVWISWLSSSTSLRAAVSNWLITLKGTELYFAVVRETVCTRRHGGIWWEGNGFV